MPRIQQTNYTMLFDAANPKVDSLFAMLSEGETTDGSISDDKVLEIEEKLMVGSFDDYLKKFKPTVYGYWEDGVPFHSLEPPTGVPASLVQETVLDRNDRTLKMLIKMMSQKGSSDKIIAEYGKYDEETKSYGDYGRITGLLAPDKAVEDMKELRRSIDYLERKNAEYEKDSPMKKNAVAKLIGARKETVRYYNNFGALLTLTTGILKERVDAIAEKNSRENGGGNGGGNGEPKKLPDFRPPVLIGTEWVPASEAPQKLKQLLLESGEASAENAVEADNEAASESNTSLTAESQNNEVSTNVAKREETEEEKKIRIANTHSTYQENTKNALIAEYNSYMEQICAAKGEEYDPNSAIGSFQRELIVNVFANGDVAQFKNMGEEETATLYDLYAEKNLQYEASFMNAAKVLIEKVLDVKAFFDQYGKPKNALMSPKLLVVNAALSQTVDESNIKKTGTVSDSCKHHD